MFQGARRIQSSSNCLVWKKVKVVQSHSQSPQSILAPRLRFKPIKSLFSIFRISSCSNCHVSGWKILFNLCHECRFPVFSWGISLMRSENRLLSWIYNFQFMLLIAHSSLMKGHANKSPWTGNCSGKRHVDGLSDGISLYCLLGKWSKYIGVGRIFGWDTANEGSLFWMRIKQQTREVVWCYVAMAKLSNPV